MNWRILAACGCLAMVVAVDFTMRIASVVVDLIFVLAAVVILYPLLFPSKDKTK